MKRFDRVVNIFMRIFFIYFLNFQECVIPKMENSAN